MLPVGTELEVCPTVAVRVTDCPRVTGFGVALTVICSTDDVLPYSNAPMLGGLLRVTPAKSDLGYSDVLPAPIAGLPS